VAPDDPWVARYEDLRRTAMDGARSPGASWGLALFVRRGLTAWMHAWPQQENDNPPEPRLSSPGDSSLPLPASLTEQLVTVLASMVFTARQELLV